MTLISDILLKMFLTKLDSENIMFMSPSPEINHNCQWKFIANANR